MLRLISEIAVAMRVASVRENPRRVASARASARAATRSASALISTTTSSSICRLCPEPVEDGEGLVEIEGRSERCKVEVEMGHRDRNIGLDPDNDRLGAAKAGGDCQRSKRSREEGVDHV